MLGSIGTHVAHDNQRTANLMIVSNRFLAGAVAAIAGLAATVGSASAQYQPGGAFPRAPSPYANQRAVNQAGVFDYYLMSLSWSPSYCASLPKDGYDPQCHRRDGRRYSFVLHGLWPQFNRGWPQDCPSADRGFVPRDVANKMLDVMPSDKLVFHEYRKHGVCSGLGVNGYVDLARKLHAKVNIPEKYRQINDPRLFVNTEDVLRDFRTANPQMKPDSIVLECGGPGPRLKEVRICFSKTGEFQSCGRNEDQKKLCSATRIFVPPVREGAAGAAPASAEPPKSTAPLPFPSKGDRKI